MGPGGAERQFFLFGKGLEKRGWSVCYITDNNVTDKDKATVMPVEMASFAFIRGNKGGFIFDCLSILYAMWRADSNYYVLKTPAFLLIPMYLFTLLFRRKLVFWAQMEFDAYPELRPPKKLLGLLQGIGTRCADIILAQNKSQVEGFRKNFGKEAKLIKNISGDLSAGNGRTNSDKEKVDVLWVGNSLAKKRYEVAVALAKMLPDYSFAVAMCVADPARYAEAETRCHSVANINFLGAVNPVEMESWYGKARLLLNTSRQEGFPNAYLQAWQHGVPVVSLCIDPDDVVTEYGLGIVMDKGLTEALKGDEERYAEILLPSINRMLMDADFYQSVSDNAKSYVAKNHGEAVLVGMLERCLLDS